MAKTESELMNSYQTVPATPERQNKIAPPKIAKHCKSRAKLSDAAKQQAQAAHERFLSFFGTDCFSIKRELKLTQKTENSAFIPAY